MDSSCLPQLARFTRLEDLDLSMGNFTRDLQQLSALSRLTSLNLEKTWISEEEILTLTKLSGLQFLNVTETGCTDQAVARLEEVIPGLRVMSDCYDDYFPDGDEHAAEELEDVNGDSYDDGYDDYYNDYDLDELEDLHDDLEDLMLEHEEL